MAFDLNLPLARFAVDRDYLARERAEILKDLTEDQTTRVLALHRGLTLLDNSDAAAGPSLKLLLAADAPEPLHRVYLGRTTQGQGDEPVGTPVLLHVLSDEAAVAIEPEPTNWHHLRKSGAGLSDRDAGLFAQAAAIANWHETHQFCPNCGGETVVERGGWSRRCAAEGRDLFPRTDPAIIVAVTDHEDRILLGSQGVWEENRFSILAGFVEPGESLEAAVAREMFEEAGVRVGDIAYLGSQAWPFPYSLMLGFTAKLAADFDARAAVADGQEIEKLRWFSRQELVAEAPNLLLPSRVSIARAIIERWLGYEVDSATELSVRH